MKRILRIASKAVQMVLAAPVKLPVKIQQVAKYVAVALGILEAVVQEDERKPDAGEEGCGETPD